MKNKLKNSLKSSLFRWNSSTPWMKCHSRISESDRNESRQIFSTSQSIFRTQFSRWSFSFHQCLQNKSLGKQQNCATPSVAKENKMQNRGLSQDVPIAPIRQFSLAFLFLSWKLQFSISMEDCRKCFSAFSKGWKECLQWKLCLGSVLQRAKMFASPSSHGTTSSRVYDSNELYLRSFFLRDGFFHYNLFLVIEEQVERQAFGAIIYPSRQNRKIRAR